MDPRTAELLRVFPFRYFLFCSSEISAREISLISTAPIPSILLRVRREVNRREVNTPQLIQCIASYPKLRPYVTPDSELEEMQRSFDRLSTLIFVFDVFPDRPIQSRFQFLLVNSAYTSVVGLTTDEVRRKTPRECLPIKTALSVEQRYQECLALRASHSYIERLLIKGEWNYWHTKLDPEFSDRGEVVRIIGSTQKKTDEVRIETISRNAFRQQQFELWYQPICRLSTGDLQGYEALVRLPGTGLNPDDFLPVIDDCGLMPRLNEFVIREATETLSLLDPPLWVAINLSEFGVEHVIQEAVNSAQVSSDRLAIEILENVNPKQIEAASAELSRLKNDGHTIKLDDVGASDLFRLQTFSVDALKIDKTFVMGMTGDPKKRAIVNAIVGIAKAYGYEVIAEGVEDEPTRQQLLALGCHYGQGYFYSPALSREKIIGDL